MSRLRVTKLQEAPGVAGPLAIVTAELVEVSYPGCVERIVWVTKRAAAPALGSHLELDASMLPQVTGPAEEIAAVFACVYDGCGGFAAETVRGRFAVPAGSGGGQKTVELDVYLCETHARLVRGETLREVDP